MANNSVLAKMAIQISADAAGFNRALSATQTNLQKFTGQVTSLASTLGFAFGATAIFGGLKYGLGIIRDFQHRMSEVRAITQASDKEFEALKNSALALGKSTKFTAEEVAQLQVEYGKLGFTTKEILAATEATLQLSVATGEDLAKSADIAGSTLRAFNLDATEMQRVVDVMAASFNKSALGLENFGEAMKYVAPVAAAANVSLEETTAMLGVLADAGIRGSMAGTSLRKIISDVKGETGTLAERLQKLAEKGLTGAGAMDEVGRTAYASLLVLTKHVGKVNDATEAYKNATGEGKKMADLMGDDLDGDIAKLNSSFESLILSGGGIEATLRELVQGLTDLINVLNSSGFIKAVSEGLGALLKQALVIPNIVKAIKEYNKATESAHGAQTTWTPEIDKTTEALDNQAAALDKVTSRLTNLKSIVGFGGKIGSPSQDEIPDFSNKTPFPDIPMTEDQMHAETTALLGLTNQWGEYGEVVIDTAEKVEEASIDMASVMSNAIAGIGQALGNAMSGSEKLGDGLLKVIGGVLVQLGGMLITAGLGVEAFKKSLESLNGFAAIAAGIALVAIGTAVAGSIKGLGKNPTGGGGGRSSSGGGNVGGLSNRGLEIQLGGEWTIKGEDLVYVFNRQNQLNGRTRG